jgi:hypothetical protein
MFESVALFVVMESTSGHISLWLLARPVERHRSGVGVKYNLRNLDANILTLEAWMIFSKPVL